MSDKNITEYNMIQELGQSGRYNGLVSWFGDMAVYEKAPGVEYKDIEAAYQQMNKKQVDVREFPFRVGYGCSTNFTDN